MGSAVGRLVLAFSAMGLPLTQQAIRRFGLRGAWIVEAVCGGLLLRDVAMLAAGTPRRLRRGPAVLLWLETAVAAAAVLAGFGPLISPNARERASEAKPRGFEAVRRTAVGALF